MYAIAINLFMQREAVGEGKTLPDEELRRTCQRDDSSDFSLFGQLERGLHQPRSNSAPANRRVYSQRSNFRESGAVPLKRYASDDRRIFHIDKKSTEMPANRFDDLGVCSSCLLSRRNSTHP